MFDLIIKNGWLCQGYQAEARRADIGIRSEKIVAIGDSSQWQAEQIIDAQNKVVIPGIIDVHTHYDQCFTWNGLAEHVFRQGVTSVVGGNCGLGFNELESHFEELQSKQRACRYGLLVPHGPVRDLIVPRIENRSATARERQQLQEYLRRQFSLGALGWSYGPYESNLLADTEELEACAQVAGECDRLIVAHRRCEGPQVLDATQEFLLLAQRSKARAHISHLKVAGKQNWQGFESMLQLMDRARTDIDLSFDLYPYDGSLTYLSALIPSEFKADGQLRSRLEDRNLRNKILQGMTTWFENRQGPEDIVCFGPDAEDQAWILADLAEQLNLSPQAAALTLIEKDPNCQGGWAAYKKMMAPMQVEELLSDSTGIVASDAVPEFGQIAEDTHPRAYGTFARMLSRCWTPSEKSEQSSAEECAKKICRVVTQMTGLPAKRFGLDDLGQIEEGFAADLVILEPSELADQASYETPAKYPRGIDRVYLAGECVLDDQGKIHQPSRQRLLTK